MKLTNILIGLVFGIVIISAFMTLYADSMTYYNPNNYDNTSFVAINQNLEYITEDAQKIENRLTNVTANPLIPDVLGVLVISGYGAVQIATSSIEAFINTTFAVFDFLPLGDLSTILKVAVVTSLILIFFIGILAHYLRQSDRL